MPSGHRTGNIFDPDGISPTIMSNHGYPAFVIEEIKEDDMNQLIQVAQIYDKEKNPTNGRVYDPCGLSPTLTTPTGGNSMPLIMTKEESEMNSRLKEMLENGQIPFMDGLWIDTYNKSVNPLAGTLRTTIDSANMHYVMEQIPFNTADNGLAYTITTRYGAMCASNLIDGNFPMTGILTIDNPTEEMKRQIENGMLNFDKGMPKEPKISVHPLCHAMEFKGRQSIKTVSPALRATDYKCPHVVYEPCGNDMEPTSCAIRGRGNGSGYRQEIEIGDTVANALTTVQKDSMVFESEDPTIICLMPWNRPGGDVGDISPSITSSAWEHNNYVKQPFSSNPMVMADPRKNYGRFMPSSESSPTLLSTDYKSPHLVMESAIGRIPFEVTQAAEKLRIIVAASRSQEVGVTINPDFSLRPHKLNKAKDGISEYCIDYDESIGSTNISARPNNVYGKTTRFRIRKLTPRECYRLMDVPEENIDRLLSSGISKSQHYKLAGNSIVVSCLYHIFKSLFTNEIPQHQQLSLF